MNRHLLLVIPLVGCSGGEPPPPSEVRDRISKDLATVAEQADASTAEGKSLPDTSPFSLLQNGLTSPFEGIFSTTEISARVSRLADRFVPHAKTSSRAPADGEEADPFGGAEAAQWLNDNLFTDANHAGDGIYNVPASLACTDDLTMEVDADCAEQWAKIELRIRVSEDDSVLRFHVQLGPDHDEPLSVGLSAKLLSLTVDLDEAEHAARALAPKLGEQLPNFDIAGQVTAKLEVPGAAAAHLSLTFDRNIMIKFAEAGESLDGDTAFRFASAKAPVASLSLDGNSRSMEASIGLGATTAHVPDETDGNLDLDLPGLTGTAKYSELSPLRVSNVSLGTRTTTMKIGGATAVALDLNPNDGRALNMQLTGDLLEVSPRLDFRAQVNHVVLGDDPPVYDVTRIALEGGLRGRADGQIEIAGGTLAIETNPASFGASGVNGQCLSGVDQTDATGRSYTRLAIGPCN